jgi:hypothetical protein
VIFSGRTPAAMRRYARTLIERREAHAALASKAAGEVEFWRAEQVKEVLAERDRRAQEALELEQLRLQDRAAERKARVEEARWAAINRAAGGEERDGPRGHVLKTIEALLEEEDEDALDELVRVRT